MDSQFLRKRALYSISAPIEYSTTSPRADLIKDIFQAINRYYHHRLALCIQTHTCRVCLARIRLFILDDT